MDPLRAADCLTRELEGLQLSPEMRTRVPLEKLPLFSRVLERLTGYTDPMDRPGILGESICSDCLDPQPVRTQCGTLDHRNTLCGAHCLLMGTVEVLGSLFSVDCKVLSSPWFCFAMCLCPSVEFLRGTTMMGKVGDPLWIVKRSLLILVSRYARGDVPKIRFVQPYLTWLIQEVLAAASPPVLVPAKGEETKLVQAAPSVAAVIVNAQTPQFVADSSSLVLPPPAIDTVPEVVHHPVVATPHTYHLNDQIRANYGFVKNHMVQRHDHWNPRALGGTPLPHPLFSQVRGWGFLYRRDRRLHVPRTPGDPGGPPGMGAEIWIDRGDEGSTRM